MSASFEPVDCGCAPERHTGENRFNDHTLFCLLMLGILLFGFYFVFKAGVKNGLTELLSDSPLQNTLGLGNCR